MKKLAVLGLVLVLVGCLPAMAEAKAEKSSAKNPIVKLEVQIEKANEAAVTGDVIIELFADEAPVSVTNFLAYVNDGFYNNTIFHRVIDGFMIQGGGFERGLVAKKTRAPIKNEATNKISNATGTIAMARTSDIDSGTAQFFINVNDNTFLDHRDQTRSGFGYAVFGKVVEGMDVVNAIKGVKTAKVGYFSDVPASEVVIVKATILREGKTAAKAKSTKN